MINLLILLASMGCVDPGELECYENQADQVHLAGFDEVRLTDAKEFGCTFTDTMHAMMVINRHESHYDDILKTNLFASHYERWRNQIRHKTAAWNCLQQSLCAYGPRTRLENLAELRRLIGPEAYNARRMPNLGTYWGH